MSRLKAHLREIDPTFKSVAGDPPLRAELFNVEQMEQHGRALAARYSIGQFARPVKDLLSRLNENEEILSDVHHLILESLRANHQITPAGEWLLDNFYLIEDHIRLARMHLPKGYSEELPRLANGPSAGLPRVYDIAKEIISHGDGRLDTETLRRFVKAYQTVTPLKIGELWAIPIMLRLALIENLRRVAYNVALGRIDRNLADFWAEQMIDILEKDPKSLILVAADMARSNPPMTPPFVSGFTRRLQGQSSALALPVTWIEQRLSQENQTIAQLIQIGNQQLAADQVSISNCIASLRFLGALNWKDFVEEISIIDTILRTDPAEIYHKMDFQTRDQYRHIIESISKHSYFSETEIANEAIHLAVNARKVKHAADRTAHVGYYLVDKGLKILERNVKRRKSFPQKIRQLIITWPKLFYIGSIVLFTALFVWGLSGSIRYNGFPAWLNGFLYLILALSVSHLSVSLINWLTTMFALPKLLPRLDLSDGIPSESRTLVVVPSMLISETQIEDLVEDLEVRFLANQDKNLLFGLLTDFLDADKENIPEDSSLIDFARNKIVELNKKYRIDGETFFYFFHRPRIFNPKDKTWMGYERKRGKLADLNKLIKGKGYGKFSVVIGNTTSLTRVKYVITLDTDTELPRDSARQMIATMSHPLNKPVFDTKKKIVSSGYGILQPRVAVSLPGTNKSLYAKLFGNEPGIDPYTRAISDVYQDLFNEGSFIGKGIYDVNVFEQVLGDRFPENRILSHDLLEGCYTRSGLLSDILLFEEYPSEYLSDVKRRHRWIRGDWQLLPWLMPVVPLSDGNSQWNPLSGLSWWKLFDNLRRSLVPVSLLLLLIATFT
ncbi:MAG TPA: hypothetical protein VHI78_06390, partial [Bacteroidales bacterium]|nr:hypothetical protein [Bacteroidales bacterium]